MSKTKEERIVEISGKRLGDSIRNGLIVGDR